MLPKKKNRRCRRFPHHHLKIEKRKFAGLTKSQGLHAGSPKVERMYPYNSNPGVCGQNIQRPSGKPISEEKGGVARHKIADASKAKISPHGMVPSDQIEPGKLVRFSDDGEKNQHGLCILYVNPGGPIGEGRGPPPPKISTRPIYHRDGNIKFIIKGKKMAFDLEKLKLPQNYASMAGAEKVITRIPVRKPNRQEYIRVRKDEGYKITAGIVEDKFEREIYLVDPSMLDELVGEWTPVRIVTAISRQGVLMLWPLKLPGEDGRSNPWHESALEAASIAETNWIRLAANMSLGAYEVFKAVGDLPEPEFPDLPFEKMIETAFKNNFIDSPDHTLVKKFKGEI